MKNIRFPALLMLIPAGLGLFLRRWLYAVAVDISNLVAVGHPLEWLLWLSAAAAAVLTALTVRNLPATRVASYDALFPASFSASFGHILLAGGILLTVLQADAFLPGPVGTLWNWLGLASAPLLLWAGFCRARGERPNVLSHAAPCVFLVLHMIAHYQTWCSNPQLQDYLFAFLGAMGMTLLSYCHADFDAGDGNPRLLTAAGMMTLYLCVVELGYTDLPYLYIGGAVWAGTSLCAPERKQEVTDADS